MKSLSRRQFISSLPLLGAGPSLGLCAIADPQDAVVQPVQSVLFENVRIFDSGRIQPSTFTYALLDRSGTIRTESSLIASEGSASVIAGKGRTLIPELIETHAEIMAARPTGEVLVEIPEWNYLMVSVKSQSYPRTRVSAFEFAEKDIKRDRIVDAGIVIAPRIWPKSVVVSGFDISHNSVGSGNRQSNRRASLVSTALSACKEIDTSRRARFNPASTSYWGTFASIHADTAHAIMTAMPGASGSHAKIFERYPSWLMVWPTFSPVNCARCG